MPRNGAGVYNLVSNTWFPAVNGVLATSTDWGTFITDVQSALTQSVSSDGQTVMTGNLPMGGNKITGMANGSAATDAAAFGQIAQIVGQCQLTKSGSNLILLPYNGNKLFINGVLCTVPAAGLTLAPGALSASTVYNIYAVATGTAVSSIEASTTARATDATYGNQVKNGDSTRALVGKAMTTAGTAWADAINTRLVISWFNRRPIQCQAGLGSNTNNTGTSGNELSTTLQNLFLSWGDSAANFTFDGYVSNSTALAVSRSGLALDGTALEGTSIFQDPGAANVIGPVSATSAFVPSEGSHYVTAWVSVSAGTGTWGGSGTTGLRCSVKGVIQG